MTHTTQDIKKIVLDSISLRGVVQSLDDHDAAEAVLVNDGRMMIVRADDQEFEVRINVHDVAHQAQPSSLPGWDGLVYVAIQQDENGEIGDVEVLDTRPTWTEEDWRNGDLMPECVPEAGAKEIVLSGYVNGGDTKVEWEWVAR